jgi:hypothetical protein
MNRRDFLKGFSALALDALLARRHGALISGREQVVQWGKENGVIKPQWQGLPFCHVVFRHQSVLLLDNLGFERVVWKTLDRMPAIAGSPVFVLRKDMPVSILNIV